MADPKIRAGLEAIQQANADSLTSSLPPNPTLLTDGQYPAPETVHAGKAGRSHANGRANGVSDRLVSFREAHGGDGRRRAGVRQSEADYADLVRQRVTATATAFYDVMEAKSLLDLARQDTENLTRLEAATHRAVDAGGRPVVELNRVRLDLLKSQQDLREAESALAIAKAKLERSSAAQTRSNLRRGRQSRRALDCGAVARRGSICAGPGEPARHSVLAGPGFQGPGGYRRRAAKGVSASHAPVRLHPAVSDPARFAGR